MSILSPKAAAVLSEILEALRRLSESGEEYTIFIDKMGLDQNDRQMVRDSLGTGGVKVSYDATSEPAEWQESNVSGIWFGVFYGGDRKPIMETIEICRFPQVAAAQMEDIQSGVLDLAEKLAGEI